MRLFIGLDANILTDECKQLQALLPEDGLSKTAHYHLTLKFLGEIQPENVEKIKIALQQIKAKKFVLQTTCLGVFPSEKYIRVVWLGLGDEASLFSLQQAIDSIMRQFGFPKEKEFQPHITLARVKFSKGKEKLLKAIKDAVVKKMEIPVNEFILYQSIRTNSHPQYEPILRVQLL